ncbi:MAG: isochorismatase family cysteine hydrolase [Bryobacteraceae bacterium]
MSLTTPDPQKSVLITIDVQVDFTMPGAPAEIAGTAAAVPNMLRLVKAFRAANRPIAHMVRLYKPDGSNVDLCRRDLAANAWNVATPGGDGSQIIAELTPPGTILDHSTLLNGHPQRLGENEWAFYKPRWGAFYQTSLEAMLGMWDVNTAVFCGCNFPNCPRTSIYQASERDLRVMVISDALSGLYDQGRRELENIGVVVTDTDLCLNWLRDPSLLL